MILTPELDETICISPLSPSLTQSRKFSKWSYHVSCLRNAIIGIYWYIKTTRKQTLISDHWLSRRGLALRPMSARMTPKTSGQMSHSNLVHSLTSVPRTTVDTVNASKYTSILPIQSNIWASFSTAKIHWTFTIKTTMKRATTEKQCLWEPASHPRIRNQQSYPPPGSSQSFCSVRLALFSWTPTALLPQRYACDIPPLHFSPLSSFVINTIVAVIAASFLI